MPSSNGKRYWGLTLSHGFDVTHIGSPNMDKTSSREEFPSIPLKVYLPPSSRPTSHPNPKQGLMNVLPPPEKRPIVWGNYDVINSAIYEDKVIGAGMMEQPFYFFPWE